MVREADEDIASGRVGPFDKEATMRAVIGAAKVPLQSINENV
jgi:hypothetical protein